MKAIIPTFTFLLFSMFSNFYSQSIKERYQASQPQDASVPPPPRINFPAQFPGGNRDFVEKLKAEIKQELFCAKSGKFETVIILKISAEGEVLNISTYGKNEIFNAEVIKAAKIITQNIKWEAGKNRLGQKVIDVTRIPFKYISKT